MITLTSFIKKLPDLEGSQELGVYPRSIKNFLNSWVFMIRQDKTDRLIVFGPISTSFKGDVIEEDDFEYMSCPLSYDNAETLRILFPFTKPTMVLNNQRSMGLGDRLGIAGDGHLQIISEYDAYPVLAQQSIRELNLTNRTYKDVLDAATFSVFRMGYTRGFGADGDHLKTFEDIEYALSLGFTMITLDCSDHIRNDILSKSDEEIRQLCTLDKHYENTYLNKNFDFEGKTVEFDEMELKRCILIYEAAIRFTKEVYDRYFKSGKNQANFEISIDETTTPTTPTQHFFVANELISNSVHFDTVAPRFCGEFQKGIDYIGDIAQFEKELEVHAAIARHFNYKLSIHSGSDKFSIFESIGRITQGRFHVKTAGTNWLEAMKVIAISEPALYREIHKFALSRFEEAKKYYHVTTNIDNIPDVDDLSDADLRTLFSNNDSRQLIHITYGFILYEKDNAGNYLYRDKFFDILRNKSQLYANELYNHIGKHLELLYKGF